MESQCLCICCLQLSASISNINNNPELLTRDVERFGEGMPYKYPNKHMFISMQVSPPKTNILCPKLVLSIHLPKSSFVISLRHLSFHFAPLLGTKIFRTHLHLLPASMSEATVSSDMAWWCSGRNSSMLWELFGTQTKNLRKHLSLFFAPFFSSPFSLSWIHRKSKTQLFLTFQWRGLWWVCQIWRFHSYLFADSEVATKFYKWKDMWWCHVSRFFSQKSPSSDWNRIENHPKRGFTMKLWKPGWRSIPTLLLICSDHSVGEIVIHVSFAHYWAQPRHGLYPF